MIHVSVLLHKAKQARPWLASSGPAETLDAEPLDSVEPYLRRCSMALLFAWLIYKSYLSDLEAETKKMFLRSTDAQIARCIVHILTLHLVHWTYFLRPLTGKCKFLMQNTSDTYLLTFMPQHYRQRPNDTSVVNCTFCSLVIMANLSSASWRDIVYSWAAGARLLQLEYNATDQIILQIAVYPTSRFVFKSEVRFGVWHGLSVGEHGVNILFSLFNNSQVDFSLEISLVQFHGGDIFC